MSHMNIINSFINFARILRVRMCVCAREYLITIHAMHRKLVVNGVLVYIHDAHIRLGIGFAG